MEPFNLERALAGDPVVNGRGLRVIELHITPDWWKTNFPLLVMFENGLTDCYEKNGAFSSTRNEFPSQLFMAPKKVTKWVVLMKNRETGSVKFAENAFEDEKQGNNFFLSLADNQYWKPLVISPISWEE